MWLLSVALIYGGIFIRWIGARNEYHDTNWISGFEVSAIGALGLVILIALSLFGWFRRCYWTPALLLPCLGVSIYLLGSATEYVDAYGRLHESLPFLAGGAGFFFLGIGYFILLIFLGAKQGY